MHRKTPRRAVGPAPELGPSVFAARRDRFLERIGAGVAVIPAAPELVKSRDTEIPFRQSSDLHYLTGFPEPRAVAVLTPHDADHRFTLFVRERAPEQEAWSGPRIGVESVVEEFGATAAYPIDELQDRLPGLLRPADRIHYPVGAMELLDAQVADALVAARRQRQRAGTGPAGIVDLEVSTGELRLLKDEHELERIRTAAVIAAEGHVAAIERTRPGVGEWEIQAALEATFRALGAAPPAFASIVGAGPNATILHYVANQSRVREGDLVLIDAGAEWGMYCSDITRTFPASGTFSGPQRDLYEVVLAAEEAAIAAAVPGAPFSAIHDAAVRTLVRGMLDLHILPPEDPDGIIESGAFRKYFLHQSSHWLGLDVHDVGPYREGTEPITLRPGMVLTVEPGIYLPAEASDLPDHFRGLGIRIEDDLIITADGNEVITRGVPVLPDDLEAIMTGGR